MDDQPKNVKDLLVELKDASELMVDLAYAAVFFNDEKVAREVGRLEQRMSEHLRRLRMMAMLAARSPEDAEGMAGVLWIADAIEEIGDAASDIARVVAARLGIPDALRPDLRHADEMTARVKVRQDAPAGGQTLRELSLPTRDRHVGHGDPQRSRLGVRPGSRRRGERRRRAADPGPEEGVNEVRELAGAPPMPLAPDDDTPALSELDRAVDILVEMKDLAEAAVGMAYSSLLFNNRSLAAEVGTLEARSDQLHDELESWVLRAAPEARDPDELRGPPPPRRRERVHLRRRPRHDLVRRARRAAAPGRADGAGRDRGDQRRHHVQPGSPAAGRSLKELRLETETGMFVLAIQRGARWIYRPRGTFVLLDGDRLISVGPEEGEEALWALTGAPVAAEL